MQKKLSKKINKFLKLFKPNYAYGPIAYLGRKNVERIFDAKIEKYKKVQKQLDA